MIFLRSCLFNLLFYGSTVCLAVMLLPCLISAGAVQKAGQFWGWWACQLLLICGLRHRQSGDPLIMTQVIYAVKHQSAWETLVLYWQLRAPVVVVKRELLWIPILGWFFRRAGCIGLDRGAGVAALRQLRRQAEWALEEGRSVLIFPQGTRLKPRARAPYQHGVFVLYNVMGVKVVPVALNSGLYWGRGTFVKYPGWVEVRYLPALKPGLGRGEFMEKLEQAVENEMAQLEKRG